MDWFINFLGETTKDNLFICDGKGEELYNVGKYILDLPNVENKRRNIWLHQRCRKFNG